MTRARDLANLAGSATGLATDAELSSAIAGIDLTNVQRIVPVDSNISVPGAPTSVSGTEANASSSVSFVAPTSNGGSTILSYTVISSPGNIKKSGSSSPIVITGLTNGTAYTFTVKAHNIAGSSTASTASSSVTPVPAVAVDYLVLAGGGGGAGAGGGAGGLRSTVTAPGGGGTLETALNASKSTNYTVTVGAGGALGNNVTGYGANGSNSVFSTITSVGGGAAGGGAGPGNFPGNSGGCGAGGAVYINSSTIEGGAGTANQGYAGGTANGSGGDYGGAGGGGAGAVGQSTTGSTGSGSDGGNGGAGVASSITGSSVTYGVGGEGYSSGGGASAANVGKGGDGKVGAGGGNGNAGGSGVVILRYLTSEGTITIGAGLTGTTATDGSYKVTTLTAGTGNVSWA